MSKSWRKKELEKKGREDLVRQGYNIDNVQHRLEMDMRYGNQRVTTSVALEINRLNNVGDVLHVIRKFAEVYADRYGTLFVSLPRCMPIVTVKVSRHRKPACAYKPSVWPPML